LSRAHDQNHPLGAGSKAQIYISINAQHTFDVRVEPVMLMKFAPASVASALARSVFPVPGGPKSKIPLQG